MRQITKVWNDKSFAWLNYKNDSSLYDVDSALQIKRINKTLITAANVYVYRILRLGHK